MNFESKGFVFAGFYQRRDDSGASVSLQKVRSRQLQHHLLSPCICAGLVA